MNKYRKLAFNTIVFAVGSFGSKIFSLLLNNLYTRHISPADFYTKTLIETTALFLLPVFTFSLTEAVVRYGLDRKYSKKQIFTTASVLIFAGLMLMIIFMPFTTLIPFMNPVQEYTVMLTVYVCVSSVRSLCSQFVRAMGMVRLFAFDGILTTMLLFVFNVLFISHMEMGVRGFMLSVILSDFCSSVFLFISCRLYRYLDIKHFNRKLGKSMMRFSLPLIPTTVMWTFTGFSDQIFIGNMCSENSAGIYSASAKIPNLLSMLSTIFFQAWNISAITENDSEDRNEFYSKIYSSYESVLFIGSAGLIFLIKPISAILINYNTFPEYSKAYLYAPVLITASVFTCLDQFLSGIYSATKHTLNSLVTVAVACIANIILNTHLIPVWEINGASTATFLSYFICFCIRIADSRRYIPFKFSMLKNILNTLLILIMCRFTYEQSGIIPTAIIMVIVIIFNIRAVYETFRMIFPHR
ncbi:MAG: polysaccharide biosynthesis C-terminal domain-containing protein [Ruminococcus sp.]|nr:polysaccharide biosynthesis C-terminal domain-containing protein [Ruminococcus sp.]